MSSVRSDMFQSTRPVRGATSCSPRAEARPHCFNPRAPCGARPSVRFGVESVTMFQSTRPVRGATEMTGMWSNITDVSIHAPRAGRDKTYILFSEYHPCFNPRAPCGARRFLYRFHGVSIHVSIHAPRAGRDSLTYLNDMVQFRFNPRAPCGARLDCLISSYVLCRFNPRAPCGARRISFTRCTDTRSFNPRAPCGARPYH